MTVELLDSAAAVTLTSAELARYGFTPHALTAPQALLLARKALEYLGRSISGPVELEAYPGAEEVLLLLRPAKLRPRPVPLGGRGRLRRRDT